MEVKLSQSLECKHQYIYLFRPVEYENVYKIGKTTRSMRQRMREYDFHDIQVKFFLDVSEYCSCDEFEKKILKIFNKKFKKSKETQNSEYFIGDYNEMIEEIMNLRKTYLKNPELKNVELKNVEIKNVEIKIPKIFNGYDINKAVREAKHISFEEFQKVFNCEEPDKSKFLDLAEYICENGSMPSSNQHTRCSKSWSFMHDLANAVNKEEVSFMQRKRFKLTSFLPKFRAYIEGRMINFYLKKGFSLEESFKELEKKIKILDF